jgi:sulfide:quinone oxidoreductase
MELSPPPRVVVLGTGVAAIEATFLLQSRLGGRIDLQVVSDSERFRFRPNLVYVPFGAPPEASELWIAEVLMSEGIPLLVQRVEGVDTDAGYVHLVDGGRVPYEHLVIATGAMPLAHEIPGIAKHAMGVWSSEQALTLRDRFTHLRGQAREGRSARVVFAVPRHNQDPLPLYEVALMLETWLRREHARSAVDIVLLTSELSFAEALGPRMSHLVGRELGERGIDGHLGEVLDDVRPHEASFAGGRVERFDLLVTIAPHGAAIRYDGLPVDERGFLRVDGDTRQVLGHPELYAPGAAGNFPFKDAFLALRQADAAAEHIASAVTGRAFTHPFDAMSVNFIDMLDRAAFAQLPLEATGDPDHPVGLRAGGEADYKVGISPAFRKSKRTFASSVLTRFAAGEPFGAGAGRHLMDAAARAMAGMLAD